MGEISVALLEEYKKLGTPEEFKKALDLVDAVSSMVRRIEAYRKPQPALLDEFNYYLENQEKFLPSYVNRVIVIKDRKVIGVYDDDLEAITRTSKEHEMGTFLVQKVTPGNADYTVILSRCHV